MAESPFVFLFAKFRHRFNFFPWRAPADQPGSENVFLFRAGSPMLGLAFVPLAPLLSSLGMSPNFPFEGPEFFPVGYRVASQGSFLGTPPPVPTGHLVEIG